MDDQLCVRRGLRMSLALEPDFEVVGEAGDGVEALALVGSLRPDVVVMDVQMPGLDGITATEMLRTAHPGCAVVILSLRDDVQTRARVRAAGAAAFVSKRESPETLITVIRRAARAG